MGYWQRPYIIAHRGIHEYYPENSFEAISAGTELNVDGFEFDVRCSKDGTLLLHHDASLKRMTGLSEKIFHMTDVQIKNTLQRAPKNRSEYFVDTISDLKTILKMFRRDYILNIELKSSGRLNLLCIQNLIALLREFSFPETIVVSSFNKKLLEKIHQLEPKIRLGLLLDEGKEPDIHLLRRDIWYSIHPHFSFFAEAKMAESFLSLGKPLFIWTVNSLPDFLIPHIRDIEGIITDDPVNVMNQIAALKRTT